MIVAKCSHKAGVKFLNMMPTNMLVVLALLLQSIFNITPIKFGQLICISFSRNNISLKGDWCIVTCSAWLSALILPQTKIFVVSQIQKLKYECIPGSERERKHLHCICKCTIDVNTVLSFCLNKNIT